MRVLRLMPAAPHRPGECLTPPQRCSPIAPSRLRRRHAARPNVPCRRFLTFNQQDWRRQPALKQELLEALRQIGADCVGATPQRAMYQPVRRRVQMYGRG